MLVRFGAGLLCGVAAGAIAIGAVSLVAPLAGEEAVVRPASPVRPAAPEGGGLLPAQPAPLPDRAEVAVPAPEAAVRATAPRAPAAPAPDAGAREAVPVASAPRPVVVDAVPPAAARSETETETETQADAGTVTRTVVPIVPAEEAVAPEPEAVAPPAPATGVALPAGSEFARAPDDVAPDAPLGADRPVTRGGETDLAAPTPDALGAALPARGIDATPAPAPGLSVPSPLGPPPEPVAAPGVVARGPEGPPATFTELAPAEEEAPAVEAALAPQEQAPEPVEAEPVEAAAEPSGGSQAAAADGAPAAAPVETVRAAPPGPEADAAASPAAADADADAPSVEPDSFDVAQAIIDTTRAPSRFTLQSEQAPAAAPATATAAPAALRAIEANAMPAPPGTAPLFSIVLVDAPGGVPLEEVVALPLPVAVALDPTAPDAGARAAMVRAAGREVLWTTAALPARGTASDVEVALAAAAAAIPDAVALTDAPDGRLGGSRTRTAAAAPALAETGHGFLTVAGGLGSGVAEARRAGVPAASAYRVLDDAGQRAPVIARFLDRATFEAQRDGATVVVGRTLPDTVEAVRRWAVDGRRGDVRVAPVSHAIRALSGG
ncbi:divergent polysaccharide deacetylase family protein [Jannaschia sp. Os4]|uniref:divergent polysaccharide deacetylase family protein n=1 Tax=Jannaschia sp. Os4 TaxID=2807617 RepID=UPI001939A9F4|nr:divergent polysaccharide deacetylase family protein [Jannaschia sp. Os4]MBM2577009.1 divergent polysaccharide deacetylase family protein [Jannaschia sp. Os4]